MKPKITVRLAKAVAFNLTHSDSLLYTMKKYGVNRNDLNSLGWEVWKHAKKLAQDAIVEYLLTDKKFKARWM